MGRIFQQYKECGKPKLRRASTTKRVSIGVDVTVIKSLPEEVEAYRDRMWRREAELRVESAREAERFVEAVGFAQAMTDARRVCPSLYVAVCGRRDAHMPRNVQKDAESSHAWRLKDEVMRGGRVYYAKLAKGRAMFVATRLVPHFNALWGVARRKEREQLSEDARKVLRVLRREWEMGTGDLRKATRIEDQGKFGRAMDELQRTLKVVPSDVLYEPMFTYIWTLAEGRFAKELSVKMSREEALREVARAFLNGAGLTLRGELARAAGLTRAAAGLGNRALVAEAYAVRLSIGVYKLADLEERLRCDASGTNATQDSASIA